MELTHTFTVPASVADTWAAFEDIESVAGCFPGATVTSVQGEEFSGSCKVKLGPIALVYNGSGKFVEKDESAHRFVVEAKGKDKRGNGTAGATVTAALSAAGPDATEVSVLTDLSITGKPAQFGRGVIQDVSDKLLQRFVDCLEAKVGSPAPESAPAPASADSADSADSAGSAGRASGEETPIGEAAASAAALAASGDETGGDEAGGEPAGGHARPADVAASQASGRAGWVGDSSGTSTGGATPRGGDDALDLGATVLPVLAKAYWKQALAVVLALLVLRRLLWGRR